jgi:hypothetical protein
LTTVLWIVINIIDDLVIFFGFHGISFSFFTFGFHQKSTNIRMNYNPDLREGEMYETHPDHHQQRRHGYRQPPRRPSTRSNPSISDLTSTGGYSISGGYDPHQQQRQSLQQQQQQQQHINHHNIGQHRPMPVGTTAIIGQLPPTSYPPSSNRELSRGMYVLNR